jgi:hypothetical protein
MPKITTEQIDQVFASADTQWDYWVALYRLAYGDDWDRVKFVEGWPTVNSEMNDYIFRKAIAFDQHHHPNVLAGGVWMNKGFSGSPDVEYGDIVLGETTWKEPQEVAV